jgi:hypothetical protein
VDAEVGGRDIRQAPTPLSLNGEVSRRTLIAAAGWQGCFVHLCASIEQHAAHAGCPAIVGSHTCKALSRAGYVPATFDNLETRP